MKRKDHGNSIHNHKDIVFFFYDDDHLSFHINFFLSFFPILNITL